MSSTPAASSSNPPQSHSARQSTDSPSRDSRRYADLNRPLPPLPQSRVEYEIPTLRHKPHSDSPNSANLKHARSFSHPFPSFFGGKKTEKKHSTRKQGNNINIIDDDSSLNDEQNLRSPSSRHPSRNVSVKTEKQPVTGQCMTCDSTVRWPQGLKVYRCSICLTINDLEPYVGPHAEAQGKDLQPRFTTSRKRTF